MENDKYLEKMRHSLSHIMAAAIKSIYPTVKFGIGPSVDNGFYYDIDLGGKTVSELDFPKIEKAMRKIINSNLQIEHKRLSTEEALAWANDNGQKYKAELITNLIDSGSVDNEELSFYQIGDFLDLCKGPHLDTTGETGPFKLLKVAGAYWLGDETREQMQRIYGVAFCDDETLNTHLMQLEEAKKRDHRKLGKELDLFHSSKLIGSGLPLFTPRGTILRDKLNELAQSYRLRDGYKKVWVPHIANLETYKVSGHFEKFPELLHFTSSESGDELALKPVNCPHHSQIFASMPRSYKDLPVKYLETTTVYRDEKKGELGGLSRVRSITQDDSHVFCSEEQVADVFSELILAAKDIYKLFDMKLSLRLSFRDDSDSYLGDRNMWDKAESAIKDMADKFNMDYAIGVGEAAIYGPKMDFMATDAIGREFQLATVQLDYALPSRFGLEYTDSDGGKKIPIMIHCALIGSIERFMSVFIEHTAGWFPFWCSPEQIRILTINNTVDDYVREVVTIIDGISLSTPIKHNELRYSIDNRNESLGKKIREATDMKIPVQFIIGPKDRGERTISVRLREGERKVRLSEINEFIQSIEE
jgi:threonyl-tRNA synthetase